jgi:signal peptidase II
MNFLIYLKDGKSLLLKKENIFFIFFIIIIFLFDRYTKLNIISHFNDNIYYVNDYINFDLIWNSGIGFGFLKSENSMIYNSITAVIGAVILGLFFFSFKSKIFEKYAMGIIVGGALGNFYDRIIYKSVPDFIDIHYNNFHWFTFNVADIFISCGIILFLLSGISKAN